jgi:hypothetical protein
MKVAQIIGICLLLKCHILVLNYYTQLVSEMLRKDWALEACLHHWIAVHHKSSIWFCSKNFHNLSFSIRLLWSQGRVKPPITQHVPIIEHFSIFSSFLNQIELLLCYWMHKLEGSTCSLKVRSKRAMKKAKEEDGWQFASKILKK